ncbi:hypothetical protein PSYPI_13139 [Pseudomonas syringae pv. pisi str. 1704B]|uniref:Uncharacterized protein n=1 Tax=Pseudomonas syringae pv. pisi str. 1704B TaxID=629263 RepID=F3G877_PSESJ|nr:hypothetical protein PSYPI_13139 [Pseudomonas syringae pv. pisi str. 1704B]
MLGHGDPDKVLANSISNGWTGIFPEKVVSNVHPFTPRRQANGPDFYDQSWRTDTSDDL